MPGQIRKMLDTILEVRGRGNPTFVDSTRTVLILNGLNPARFTRDSPDDPALLAKARAMAEKFGVPGLTVSGLAVSLAHLFASFLTHLTDHPMLDVALTRLPVASDAAAELRARLSAPSHASCSTSPPPATRARSSPPTWSAPSLPPRWWAAPPPARSSPAP